LIFYKASQFRLAFFVIGADMAGSELFDFAFFLNFDQSVKDLAAMADQEDWNSSDDATKSNKILKNYLEHTFRKLKKDRKISYTVNNQYACFNTGLFTPNYENIFAFFEKNRQPRADKPSQLFFKGFHKESDTVILKSFANNLPESANYFDDPAELIFNTKLPVIANIDHIIEDNSDRFPKNLTNSDLRRWQLSGALEEAKKKVVANYTIAIPQYYAGKIQLLLPLCLTPGSPHADLALALDKINGVYRANTCLTIQMAYNNARLIVKPYSNWLKP